MSEAQTPRCNTFITTQQQAYEQAAEELTATRAQLDLLRRDNEYLSATLQFLQDENKDLRARLAELEGFTTWLFDSAEMLYWPGNHEYPVENKPLANKNARMAMEMYFAKKLPAYKEGKK